MKARRSLSALLALLLAAGCASCGSGEVSTEEITAASGEESTTAAESSEYTDPNVDYNGETVTIASYNYSGAWNILKYNVALNEENGDIINDAIVKRNRTVEDELGIKLELFTLDSGDRGSSAKLQQEILAGDDTFTFALPMNAGIAPMLTTEGMLIDLNSIPTLDLNRSWWNQNANDEYTLYGKQLAAVGDICFFNLGAPIVTYFSKGMIEDNKLENPYELVYSGKWTLDKMAEMSAAVSRDLDGDSTVEDEDQFGFSAEVDSLGYMLMSSGIRLSEHDSNGDIKITVNTERTINAVDKLIKLFNNNDISRIHNVQIKGNSKYPSFHADYAIPKLEQEQLLFLSFQLLGAINMRASESDFGILPTPKYDEKQEEYISFANTWFSDHLIVPATNTNLEMTGNVIEAMGYYAQQIITPAYIDTTVMNKSVRDDDSAKMLELVLDTQTFDVAYIFDWGKIRSTFSSMASNPSASFSSTWASIEPAVKTALEQTIEQMK